MKPHFIPNEIFHIKKSALRLGALNINALSTGPFPLVHPKRRSEEACFHTLKNGCAQLHLHTTTVDQKALILCSKVLAHKRSQEVFVKDIKTSVYPALSAGIHREGCEATSYASPLTTMDNTLLRRHKTQIHYTSTCMSGVEWRMLKDDNRQRGKCLGRWRRRRMKSIWWVAHVWWRTTTRMNKCANK